MASKIFPNQEGLDNFLKSKSLHKISEGSEAKCYLSYVDGLAYKRISKGRTGEKGAFGPGKGRRRQYIRQEGAR